MPTSTPPSAPRRPTTLTQFGDDRVDDYFWLRERDDPAVLAYLTAENAYAESALDETAALQTTIYEEIVARIEETDTTAPVRWGAWWYYERTFEGRSYPVHCRRAASGNAPPALDGPGEQVVLDENALAEGHGFCSVGVLEIAPDHELCAVGVDFDGDERHTVTFHSLGGVAAPTESITDVAYSAAWTADGASLLYVRVDDAWRPFELWCHDLGTDPSTDRLLYREDDERFRVSITRTRDGGALVLHVSSALTTEVHVSEATSPEFGLLWPRRHGVECSIEHLTAPNGERWWVGVTNDGATDFKVVAAPRDGEVRFRDVVVEEVGRRRNGVDAFDGYLVVSERLAGDASVCVYQLLEGEDPFGDDFGARGATVATDEEPSTTVLGATPEYASTSIRVAQTSLVTPLSALDVALNDGARTVVKRQEVRGGYDASRFVSSRRWITARDGTEVPVSIVCRRDLVADDGSHAPTAALPTLLYGYGAYEISMDPVFSSSRLSLLERGAAFAIAHVRGGGELGRSWYEGGCLEHKENSFLDFVDVARALAHEGVSDPARLVAMGGSAGGLLVGAAMNLAPDAFCAVVAEVPFVDVVSTMLDESLPLTIGEWEEWGDPLHDEGAYRRLKAWSPYDNVVGAEADGSVRTYPELLVLASLNDTRVQYWEPAKWVAKLRHANPANRIIMKTDLGAGHAGPSGRYDAWRERALVYAWVADRLGVGVAAVTS